MVRLMLMAVACAGFLHFGANASDRLECPQAEAGETMEEAARFRELTAGRRSGERLMCRGPEGALTFVYRFGRYSWTRTEKIRLDDDDLPSFIRVEGEMGDGTQWVEQFERNGDAVYWMTPRERQAISSDEPVSYYPIHPAQDLGVLARALLARPDHRLKLVPGGEARITPMSSLELTRADETRMLQMYAISGIDLVPRYVWLDADGSTFAGEWMIRDGWEVHYPKLRAVMDQAAYDVAAEAKRQIAGEDAVMLAITGVRVFDPAFGKVTHGQTILIDGDRIAAVGRETDLQLPSAVKRVDGRGLMALPGLWDMHAHIADPRGDHPANAPLQYLAAGITSVRDLGGEFEAIIRLRDAVAEGTVAGPRIFAAGFIDHVDGEEHDIGEAVGTLEEAVAAVNKYADAGFGQIKTYNSIPNDLTEAIIKRSKERGLGVAGHVPFAMTSGEAIAAGYDELQHLQTVHGSLPMSFAQAIERGETWATYYQILATDYGPGSPAVDAVIDQLVANRVAVDMTIAGYTDMGQPPQAYDKLIDRLPAQTAFRLRHDLPCAVCGMPQNLFEYPAWQKVSEDWFAIINAMHRAGVTLLIGSDDKYPQEVVRYEMELLVERAGLSPTAVLRAATLDAARALGKDDQLGRIEPGKLADIILVAGDPTRDIKDIRKVKHVIQGGTLYNPEVIETWLGLGD